MSENKTETNLHIILVFFDFTSNLISLALAFLLRYQLIYGCVGNFDQIWIAILILSILIVVDIIISPTADFEGRGIFAEIIDVIKHQIIGIALAIITLYLAHSASVLSRLVFLYFLIISIILVWVTRLMVKNYLLKVFKKGDHARKLLIVSDNDNIKTVEKRVRDANEWDMLIQDVINIDECGYKNLIEYATHNVIDEALIYLPRERDKDEYKAFVSTMVSMGIRVDISIPQLAADIVGNRSVSEVGSYIVISLVRSTLSLGQQATKRLLDIIGGIVGTVIFALAFVILGPIIKLDSPGTVLFRQRRVGKNGRIFDFYKFRSMYTDAEQRKKELENKNEINGLMFKLKDDPRITKVGKFIRKTSIDELPQFWNVLKGDMSLVGTRPPTVDEYQRYMPWHKRRLSMKPGITGLWQVSGRSDIKDFDEVVALDVQYIDNWSILNDIKILCKTIGIVLTGKGAK